MFRAALLLALVQHADAQGELAERRAIRLDRLQARHEVAFVVRNAAAEEVTVPLNGLERGRGPLVERIGGLHVVVVVDEKRPLAGAGLADDRRRTTVDAQLRGVDARAARSLEDQPRRLGQADPLRGHGRLPHQRLQLGKVLASAPTHVRVEIGERRHAPEAIARSGRSSCGSCSSRARTMATPG